MCNIAFQNFWLDSQEIYFGETGRELQQRLGEHQSNVARETIIAESNRILNTLVHKGSNIYLIAKISLKKKGQ